MKPYIKWILLAWVGIVFLWYYTQYLDYARFFLKHYATAYFPLLFGAP